MEESFRKIRFLSKEYGHTAGLVLSTSQEANKSIEDLSRLFQMTEAMKMTTFQRGPVFATWDEAFNYQFPNQEEN